MNVLNEKFGKLTILEYVGLNKRKERLFKCICDCGNSKVVKFYNLNSGKTKSCGCNPTGSNVENLIGKKYTRLFVIEYFGRDKHREPKWLCKCDCGEEKVFLRKSLTSGRSKSCGCLNREHKKSLKGKLSPNYNHNLSDEDREKRRNNDIFNWAREVKIRYEWKCDICSSNQKLRSHHLNSYHWDIQNRLNIENGVCLCDKCHIEFHVIYGFKNSTLEKYNEFKLLKNERCNN